MNQLVADHLACADVLRRSRSNFALPIRLLPPAKRRGTTALYAFCRRADDIVDDAPDAATAALSLARFEAEVEAALAGEGTADPVLRALGDTVRRFAVPGDSIRAILAGVRMDLERQTYETFAELDLYCGRVATAVGVAAIHIWGFTDPAAVVVSHDCGLAFQLTNILRDIPEDLGRGRIYIPAEDFRACGCAVADLRAGRIGPEFARLAAEQVARATHHYARATALDGMLSTDGRLVFRAMVGGYRALLDAVRRAGPAIFARRVRSSRAAVVGRMLLTTCLGPRGLLR
jgi:phytoene synthase